MLKRYIFISLIIILLCISLSSVNCKPNIVRSYGNSTGNNVNNGCVAKNSNYLFYLALENADLPDSTVICIENIATGEAKILVNDNGYCINAINGWVYYIVSDRYSNMPGSIYRISEDGTKRQRLNTDSCLNMCVSSDYIFYINISDNFKLYRMDIDGKNRISLYNERSWSINLYKQYVYFASGNQLFKMSNDGYERELILSTDQVLGQFIIANDNIFYFTGDANKLFKVSLNGDEEKLIINENVTSFNVSDSYIIYENESRDGYIYRINLDGSNKKRIIKGYVGAILDNWIYSHREYGEWLVPARISMDGDENQLLCMGG